MELMHTAADLQAGYAVPTCASTGVSSSARFAPAEFDLWLVVARLETGATIQWQRPHGDEGIYLIDGALSVDGNTCLAGGVVIIESGVIALAQAESPTELVHVGPLA